MLNKSQNTNLNELLTRQENREIQKPKIYSSWKGQRKKEVGGRGWKAEGGRKKVKEEKESFKPVLAL